MQKHITKTESSFDRKWLEKKDEKALLQAVKTQTLNSIKTRATCLKEDFRGSLTNPNYWTKQHPLAAVGASLVLGTLGGLYTSKKISNLKLRKKDKQEAQKAVHAQRAAAKINYASSIVNFVLSQVASLVGTSFLYSMLGKKKSQVQSQSSLFEDEDSLNQEAFEQ